MKNLDINAFKRPITYSLKNNLTEQTCSTLSSILALDYVTRLGNAGIIEDYANSCVMKLKNFLKSRVIIDSSFSTALTLFTIAISPEEVNFQDKNNILNQDKGQDTVIEVMVAMHFSEYSAQEGAQIKLILKDLINSSNTVDMLNYLNSEPKILKKLISDSLKLKGSQQEINNNAVLEINKIFQKKLSLDVKTNSVKQQTASLITAFSTIAATAACVLTGGAILPLLIIPTAVLSMKLAPKLGEKLAETILNLDKTIKDEKNYIHKLKTEIISKNVEPHIEKKQQVKNLKQAISQHIFESRSKELAQIRERLNTVPLEGIKKADIKISIKNNKDGSKRGI